MQKQELREGWALICQDKKLKTSVPFSMYYDLLEHGEIEDPFYRDNESEAFHLSEEDYSYTLDFIPDETIRKSNRIVLRFEGIDTLADIYLNGSLLGSTYNMHRTWEFQVKELLTEGTNHLSVLFHSPVRYMQEQIREHGEIPCNTDTLDGFPYLRKSSCMSGWDWGPRLPDMGIFRKVFLLGIDNLRIEDVHVRQQHHSGNVMLNFQVNVESEKAAEWSYRVVIDTPDGKCLNFEDSPMEVKITEPLLWWPRGYGDPNLYNIRVEACANGEICDVWEKKIGLRTMRIRKDKDQWGESFAHEVNGMAIFAMGADYIPEDCLLPRITEEKTKDLLKQCVRANYNTIRVWGGAYYPDDWFYDICDELGLLVWQDLMFACSTYLLTDEFEDNISHEIVENVRRIRHHACLALWCGNNEMEEMVESGFASSPRLRGDYTRIFSYIIPKIISREDPDTFYWPSSPSSGGDFDNTQDETRGDAHYWMVWHGYRPFPDYRKHNFRYASEFGFESMPSEKTIESFTLPDDRNVFSYVMERHQKSLNGYSKMMMYMSQYFLYPKDFSSLIYASQLMQGQAMRYAVEHWRRNRGECMGAIIWQINDCWPVASWSSIDYFGRWKALQYFEKRFFAPVMISCCEEGMLTQDPNPNARAYDMEKSIHLNIANETTREQTVAVRWSLRDSQSAVIGEEHEEKVTVPALSSVWLDKVNLPHARIRQDHVTYSCIQDEEVISEGSVLFSMPKFYEYTNPQLEVSVDGDTITVRSQAYAGNVELLNENEDWVLSDNYFDMEAGEKQVKILSGKASKIRIRSIYDIAR